MLRQRMSCVSVVRLLCKRKLHYSLPTLKIIPFLLADIGEGITECEIVAWHVKPGDAVEQFSKICEVQSDKAAVEITSRYDGIIKSIKYQVGDTAKVGTALVDIDVPNESDQADIMAQTKETPSVVEAPAETVIKEVKEDFKVDTLATPSVRRLAKENNLQLSKVQGTGPKGRILKGDILSLLGKQSMEVKGNKLKITQDESSTISSKSDHEVPLNVIQKAMFKSMTKSLSIPHFGYSEQIVMDSLVHLRKEINLHESMKLSYMPFFIKALSLALLKYPILNSSVVDGSSHTTAKLLYKNAHHIGIAMDTPKGLVVPSIRNVESKSIYEIAADLSRFKELGADNTFLPADLLPGTITLSNIGNIGGTVLHPVIVEGQVCIGAIGKLSRLPRFVGSTLEIKESFILDVSFNADHRVIDGATIAKFVKCWKDMLETPSLMMLKLK